MVLQSDIDILVAEGEGSTLEYKEGLSTGFARELNLPSPEGDGFGWRLKSPKDLAGDARPLPTP